MVKDQVAEWNANFCKAVANQDIEAAVQQYAPTARLMAPNAPMAVGPEAIKAVFQSFIDMGANSLELESIEIIEAGDLVIDVGRYVLGIQPPGVDPIVDRGKFVDVFRVKSDGSLEVIIDTFNSDLPAPTA